MKLKILVFPLVLVIVIGSVIWMVVPAIEGAREKIQSLKDEQKKIADLQEKGRKIEQLNRNLGESVEQQNVLLEYIPSAAKEEEIIDSLNYIASNAGLLVSNISLLASPSGPTPEKGTTGSQSPAGASGTPMAKNVRINMEVTGKYEGIKSTLESIAKLKRFNNASSLRIGRMASVTGEETTTDTLQVKMELVFNYMEKVGLVTSVDNKIFSGDRFDLSVVDAIKNKTGVSVLELNTGATGKVNPFVP